MNLLTSVLAAALPKLLDLLDPQDARIMVDDLLDKIEAKIESSETQIDDMVVLPLINKLREIAQIPDDIGGDED